VNFPALAGQQRWNLGTDRQMSRTVTVTTTTLRQRIALISVAIGGCHPLVDVELIVVGIHQGEDS
jgi:hypothetical protein